VPRHHSMRAGATIRVVRLLGRLPLGAVALLTACGFPFDSNCVADRIVASFDGTLLVGGSATDVKRDDALVATNVSPPTFRQLNEALIEGRTPVDGVVWSHGGIGNATDFFALNLAIPVQAGQLRTVASTFQGGGWGVNSAGPDGVSVALRLGDSWASAVEGLVTVVRVSPIALDLDIEFTLSDGTTGILAGTDTFRYMRGTCPDARR
jgi:hypothetical protein